MPLEKVCGKIYIREVYKSKFVRNRNFEVYSEVKEVAERLQTDYHVVLPILDGHAGCDKQFTTIENNALDIIEFVNSKLGGSVLMMGGLSLGGQILLEILSQRKDICKFRKLDAK